MCNQNRIQVGVTSARMAVVAEDEPVETLEADLEKSKTRIMTHMNKDHAASCLAYVKYFGDRPLATSAKLVDLSSKGLILEAEDPESADQAPSRVFVPYSRPLKSVEDIWKLVIEMHHEAYQGLGMLYKLKHGYYIDGARHAVAHMSRAQKSKIFGGITACAIGAAAVVYWRRRSHIQQKQPCLACQ